MRYRKCFVYIYQTYLWPNKLFTTHRNSKTILFLSFHRSLHHCLVILHWSLHANYIFSFILLQFAFNDWLRHLSFYSIVTQYNCFTFSSFSWIHHWFEHKHQFICMFVSLPCAKLKTSTYKKNIHWWINIKLYLFFKTFIVEFVDSTLDVSFSNDGASILYLIEFQLWVNNLSRSQYHNLFGLVWKILSSIHNQWFHQVITYFHYPLLQIYLIGHKTRFHLK